MREREREEERDDCCGWSVSLCHSDKTDRAEIHTHTKNVIPQKDNLFPYGFMIVIMLKINRTTAIIIPIWIIASMQYIKFWFNTTLTGVLRSVGGRPATRDTRLITDYHCEGKVHVCFSRQY